VGRPEVAAIVEGAVGRAGSDGLGAVDGGSDRNQTVLASEPRAAADPSVDSAAFDPAAVDPAVREGPAVS
jgi:hypothetical protein